MNMERDNREEFEREYIAYLINDCALLLYFRLLILFFRRELLL